MAPAAPMAGLRIGPFEVVQQAKGSRKGAAWWCLCLSCFAQARIRRNDLLRAQDGKAVVRCCECGAV